MNSGSNHFAFMTLSFSCETCPGGERLLFETAERVLPTDGVEKVRALEYSYSMFALGWPG